METKNTPPCFTIKQALSPSFSFSIDYPNNGPLIHSIFGAWKNDKPFLDFVKLELEKSFFQIVQKILKNFALQYSDPKDSEPSFKLSTESFPSIIDKTYARDLNLWLSLSIDNDRQLIKVRLYQNGNEFSDIQKLILINNNLGGENIVCNLIKQIPGETALLNIIQGLKRIGKVLSGVISWDKDLSDHYLEFYLISKD